MAEGDLLTQRAMEYLHSHEDEIEGALRAAVGDLVSQRPADPLEHLIKVLRTRRRGSVDPDASGEEVRRLRTEVQFHKDDAAAARAELEGVRHQLAQFSAFADERLTSAERRAAAAEARAAAAELRTQEADAEAARAVMRLPESVASADTSHEELAKTRAQAPEHARALAEAREQAAAAQRRADRAEEGAAGARQEAQQRAAAAEAKAEEAEARAKVAAAAVSTEVK